MKKGLLSSFLSALNTDDTFLPSAESHDCQVSIPTGDSHILEDYCFLHLMAIKWTIQRPSHSIKKKKTS